MTVGIITQRGKQHILHRLLREVLKSYVLHDNLFNETGKHEITAGEGLTINFIDLKNSLKNLSPRQKEAIYWFVIRDQKQKFVAEQMGISTVTVGQYVESGVYRVARQVWPEMYEG